MSDACPDTKVGWAAFFSIPPLLVLGVHSDELMHHFLVPFSIPHLSFTFIVCVASTNATGTVGVGSCDLQKCLEWKRPMFAFPFAQRACTGVEDPDRLRTRIRIIVNHCWRTGLANWCWCAHAACCFVI